MITEDFNKVLQERIYKIQKILAAKSEEYVRNDNKMHNFDKGSDLTGKSREDVLLGFALKHWISVNDILDDMSKGKLPTRELVDEKLGDWINYMCLLEASIIDKINTHERMD